jgi:hypothetical protein
VKVAVLCDVAVLVLPGVLVLVLRGVLALQSVLVSQGGHDRPTASCGAWSGGKERGRGPKLGALPVRVAALCASESHLRP